MGTKKPSCTLFDNINTSDRKLQPGGRISRDPSPRPSTTAQSERDRDGNRGDVWRREREAENTRDNTRYKDMDPRERYYERDRAPVPRLRDGERERRERRQGDDRSRNGRPLSNAERNSEREEVVRGTKKGDTFPRMRESSADYGRSTMSTAEIDGERGERRQTDWPKRPETDGRERERTWQRERYREREPDESRSRAKEEGRHAGRRPVGDEKSRQRDRYQESDVGFHDKRRELGDSWDIRVREADRRRENPRPDVGKAEGRVPSPQRRRDRDIHSDRKEREKAQRRERWRDTRSEGDSEERETRRGRDRNRQREEMQYRHSQSEGENTGKTKRERDRDRQWYREEDRQRYRDRDREREVDRSRRRGVEKDGERYREFDKRAPRQADEEDRCKGSERDTKDGRLEDGRFREHKQRRCRETKEREPEPRWQDSADRGSRSLSERAPRVSQAQSSGEWSTTESDKDVEEQVNSKRAVERNQSEQKRFEKQERERVETTGSKSEQRRMWLEPQRGKKSKEESVDRERRAKERSMESQVEWGRDGQRVKEPPYDRYSDQSSYRGRHEGRNEFRGNLQWQTEGVSVDGEEVGQVRKEVDKGGKEHLSDSDGGIVGNWQRDAEGENVTDNTEESDREEEGGSDFWARSESEGGSETGWKQDRDRVLSGEDGFVTVSSGGDEGDERAEDEEEEFEDCQEFWGTAYDGPSTAAFKGDKEREEDWTVGKEEGVDEDEQGREKQPKYIFCVIGHKLPGATSGDESLPQVDQVKEVERDNPDLKSHHLYREDGAGKARDERQATQNRDDESPIINNQHKENKCDAPREERAAAGETTDVDTRYRVLPELENTATEERMMWEKEHPYAEIGPINRDPLTDRLLIEWREKNKEVERETEQPLPERSDSFDGVCSQVNVQHIQPILDVINNSGAMSPEEVEAIRIRLSGAWSLSEEPKRHSQAPHLKWAKSVVREILGLSEDLTLDEPSAEALGGQGVSQPEVATRGDRQLTEVVETGETPDFKLRMDGQHSEPELEEEPLEAEELRGMGHGQADMHADQFTAMHGDTSTYTHADTMVDTEGEEDPSLDREKESSVHFPSVKADVDVRISEESGDEAELSEIQKEARREKEVEMYLSVSNTLYKPNSCPILHCETSESDVHVPSREGEDQEVEDRMGERERERERQGEEPEETGVAEELGKVREGEVIETDGRQVVAEEQKKEKVLKVSCSFRDLGPEARLRRRGIRKTTERRNGELVEVEEEEEEGGEGGGLGGEGAGRDRRTRIFSTTGNKRPMEMLVSVLKSAPRNPHHFLSLGSHFLFLSNFLSISIADFKKLNQIRLTYFRNNL